MDASQPMQRACCVCRRVQVDERWERLPSAPQPHSLVTHTYCPQCFHEALARLHPAAAPAQPAVLELACG